MMKMGTVDKRFFFISSCIISSGFRILIIQSYKRLRSNYIFQLIFSYVFSLLMYLMRVHEKLFVDDDLCNPRLDVGICIQLNIHGT